MNEHIPVVDFSPLSLQTADSEINEADAKRLADELILAFSTVGFVYLKNTFIPTSLLDQANEVSERFFRLPSNIKTPYRIATGETHGWNELEQEVLDPSLPGDLKECYDVTMLGAQYQRWPTEIPKFKDVMLELFGISARLAHRVMFAIGLGLDLPDPHFFSNCHHLTSCAEKYVSCMRVLFYPSVSEEAKPGQVRLGAHTDYGTITLLYQDSVGGLEVRTRDNEWVEAVPIQDTVLVNIADLLQRWTDDRLVSTAHRILMPQDDVKRKTVRRSIAFFVQPDSEIIVSGLDGSNKYPPVSAGDYLKQRVLDTLQY